MKILANDGISQSGVDALTETGYEVITTNVAQEQLANFINEMLWFCWSEAQPLPEKNL